MLLSRQAPSLLVLLMCCFFQVSLLRAVGYKHNPYEGQLLDCTTVRSGLNRSLTSCDKTKIETNQTIFNGTQPNLSINSPTTSPALIFSINFNNNLRRRQVLQDDNCTNSQLVVCTPNKSNDGRGRDLSIAIVPKDTDALIVHSDKLTLSFGTSHVIQCQFKLAQANNVTELDFKLRWLRSVNSQYGFKNQSISSSGDVQNDQPQISVSMNRIWTAQSDGGLDLMLNDVRTNDSGDYFCQAVASDASILDEKRIHLDVSGDYLHSSEANASIHDDDDASGSFSVENLDKLLPSLQIIPDYSELNLGESIQLACVTTGLDPDPEPDKLEWTFEPFERPGYVPEGISLEALSMNVSGLPGNTSLVGNVLIIWSVGYESIGIYKCSYTTEELNLTSQASSELALRPKIDSAPIVYINPELLRLSSNGSAKIQCEATGYPPPDMEWYRVEIPNVTHSPKDNTEIKKVPQQTEERIGISMNDTDGLEVHQLRARDAMAFCMHSGCRALGNLESPSRLAQGRDNDLRSKTLVTGLSWVQIDQARAFHQGQYVCKASNKHGSNQASSIVDVEFKVSPQVVIQDEHRLQTIVLDPSDSDSSSPTKMQSVTFNCSVRAGQPQPQLKWLRTNLHDQIGKHDMANLYTAVSMLTNQPSKMKLSQRSSGDVEVYDLTSVSSATSKVSTQSYDGGKILSLQLSTISIDDEGDYICMGENELGRHSSVAHLIVKKPPQVRILQHSPKILRLNESFQLDCLVSGHPSPLDIEWSRSDRGAFFSLISRHPLARSADQERAVLKFDRVTPDDAGEYICAARDPSNQATVLKDTIMLVAEEVQDKETGEQIQGSDVARQIPKLLVRPTKITAELGSNVTLDCLAVSGLQPTVVEWLAPSSALALHPSSQASEHMPIRPYYRSQMMSLAQDVQYPSLLQFGSKLKLFNVSKAHEGIYQCKGRNKVGTENAPAFVEIIDNDLIRFRNSPGHSTNSNLDTELLKSSSITKTKIAKVGTNIELRCQVNGIEGQPATSWSREDRQLPNTSVQIDHNLWIQNLTKADEGLYLCSARSSEPDEILQARIRLLVNDDEGSGRRLVNGRYDHASLNARIIASKTHLMEGDSVTLECVINTVEADPRSSSTTNDSQNRSPISSSDLADIERQVIWTNLHSGQSLFQDNVFIQNNLLIIYDLRKENSATYRCNYNDLTQFADHKLQVGFDEETQPAIVDKTGPLQNVSFQTKEPYSQYVENFSRKGHNVTQFLWDVFQTRHVIVSPGDRKVLDCGQQNATGKYFWTVTTKSNGQKSSRMRVGRDMQPLVLENIDTSHAGLYTCNRQLFQNQSQFKIESQYLIEVLTVAARFVQRPVSFVTLPAVSDADQQLELEMKFFPENEHGLMLFSGGVLNNIIQGNQQSRHDSSDDNAMSINRTANALTNADYISLGLVRGYLEFRFELGDGTTLVRSRQPLELNQWHKVVIERNRRGATMWLDGQAPTSNSSTGKFFNLNLDSLLYVGGHQVFLTINNKRQMTNRKNIQTNTGRTNVTNAVRPFYGFSRGFKGCISLLRINQRDLILMAGNRSVSVGMFECDKPECQLSAREVFDCPTSRGLCQVDRNILVHSSQQVSRVTSSPTSKRMQSLPVGDLRCVCFPNFVGLACNESATLTANADWVTDGTKAHSTTMSSVEATNSRQSACELNTGHCNITGTSECEALSSSSHKCHCKIGFSGRHCDQLVEFANETSIGLSQSAFVQISFKSPKEIIEAGETKTGRTTTNDAKQLNETDYAMLTTYTENQNISFRVRTRSSYGLLFFIGQDTDSSDLSTSKLDSSGFQASKSIVANALARLFATRVNDFLAVALVDGHIELSYELGSGLAVLRSSRRCNDGAWHKIEISRLGKASKLMIDDTLKHETQSPGKLSMLNVGQDIYLGGLPGKFQTLLSTTSSSGSLLSSFIGCLSDLQINSFGPLNLVRSDHITKVKSGRNLEACGDSLLLSTQTSLSDKISIDQDVMRVSSTTKASISESPTQAATTLRKTSRKPAKPNYTTESDTDDSDEELAR